MISRDDLMYAAALLDAQTGVRLSAYSGVEIVFVSRDLYQVILLRRVLGGYASELRVGPLVKYRRWSWRSGTREGLLGACLRIYPCLRRRRRLYRELIRLCVVLKGCENTFWGTMMRDQAITDFRALAGKFLRQNSLWIRKTAGDCTVGRMLGPAEYSDWDGRTVDDPNDDDLDLGMNVSEPE